MAELGFGGQGCLFPGAEGARGFAVGWGLCELLCRLVEDPLSP